MTTLQAISNLLIYRPEKLEILHSDVGLIEKKTSTDRLFTQENAQ